MEKDHGEKKAYEKPEIIYEVELEIRAGTPLGSDIDLLDLTDP